MSLGLHRMVSSAAFLKNKSQELEVNLLPSYNNSCCYCFFLLCFVFDKSLARIFAVPVCCFVQYLWTNAKINLSQCADFLTKVEAI